MKVFIGYDPRQPIAFQVAAHSVWKNASRPVEVSRLALNQLPTTRRGLTEFTYSRFLVPWLCKYQDYAVFIDSDFVVLGDVIELAATAMLEGVKNDKPETPVWVVEHPVHKFERPSLMVFNNAECKTLTPDFVSDLRNPLFDFSWASRVGTLPAEWNFLVGYDQHPQHGEGATCSIVGECKSHPLPKALHYTQGIPCWPETKGCDLASVWIDLAKECQSSVSFNDLMGNSVHVKAVQERLANAS